MSRRMHLIVQDRITRGIDPTQAAKDVGARLTMITDDPVKTLIETDRTIDTASEKPVLFCSLQLASRALHSCASLRSGVVLQKDFLHHSTYTSQLSRSALLNPKGLYLPWGAIPDSLDMIDTCLPGDLFLRPNSPMKPYPGFAVKRSDLVEEHRLRTLTDQVDAGEMTYLAPAREIPALEYRTWIVDAQVVTHAPYSWNEQEMTKAGSEVPTSVLRAAAAIVSHLEQREQIYTADFVLINGAPKLVELNALTTSGWYPAIDLTALFRACDDIFI
jgi:hypothetical protein